jgi:excisionase family DNA binding protein
VPPRFLTLADVAEVLNISAAQAYALVRNGELPAIKVGGRGQWRVESERLERYIAERYAETADYVRAHPLGREELAAGLPEDVRAQLEQGEGSART